jgi:hypothetical protein
MLASARWRYGLKVLLYLFAIHSLIAGFLLIVLSNDGLAYFGFPVSNRFFTTQSGVFHIVMAIGYIMAADVPEKSRLLINFIILAKLIAAIFLITYFFIIERIILVIIFGSGDFLMAVVLWTLYSRFKSFKNTH